MAGEIKTQLDALIASLREGRQALQEQGISIDNKSGFKALTQIIKEDTRVTNLISRTSTNFEIPVNATSIGSYAFADFTNLTSIFIPSRITKIGNNAFLGCANLKIYCEADAKPDTWDADWNPSNCPVVWGYAVNPASDFTYTISNNKVTLTKYTGNDTTVVIPATIENYPVTSIGSSAFSSCSGLTSVVIPDSVTSIGYEAFRRCESLKSVAIGNGVTSIGDYAFYDCDRLTSVVIGDSVTTIGEQAFYDCDRLTSVVIGDSVTTIGSSAFNGCTQMQTYDFSRHTSVPYLANTNAFTRIPGSCKILVPAALYDEWIAATNWSTYADHIVAVSDPEAEETVSVIVNLTGDTYITEGLFVYDYDSGELIYGDYDQRDSYTFEVPYDTGIEISLGENIDDYGLTNTDTDEAYDISAENFPVVHITEPQTLNYEVTSYVRVAQGIYEDMVTESSVEFTVPNDFWSDEQISTIYADVALPGFGAPLSGAYYIDVSELFASIYLGGAYLGDANPVSVGGSGLYHGWDGFDISAWQLHEPTFNIGGEISGTAYLSAGVFALKLEGDYSGAVAIDDGNDWIPITDNWFDGQYTYLLSENWNDEHPNQGVTGTFKVYF